MGSKHGNPKYKNWFRPYQRSTYIYTYDSYHYMEWLTRGYKKRDAHKVVGVYLQAYIIILSHIGIMRAQL